MTWQHHSLGIPWDAPLSHGGGCGKTLALSKLTCRHALRNGAALTCWGAVTQVDGLHAAAVWDAWWLSHRLQTSPQVLTCVKHKVADMACRPSSWTVMCRDSGTVSACRIFYLPLFLLLLAVAHGSTARVLVKLALRDLVAPSAAAKPAVEDVEKAYKIELCTEAAEGALSSAPKVSGSFDMMDTAMSLT